jgi:2-hydroxycyclohexanecarboxyl-CoA dehydrogenase
MLGIEGKTVLVTGAGRGIGRSVARRLAEEGATVAVNDVDEDRVSSAVETINDAGVAGEALEAPADVTDLESLRSMLSGVEDSAGVVEILVNNAGKNTMGWFLEEDPEEWPGLVELNLLGQIYCARAVAERMVETETSGTIVGMASDAGRSGSAAQAVYSSTKAGVIGFTKSLAQELSRFDITVNAVAPGPVETEGVEDLKEETKLAQSVFENIADEVPLGRTVRPEDVASVVAFLASDDAGFLTGQVISVSGGLTMND